ncbi:hypothetical protein V9T40_005067 [Parthenolecanium corni]|uniref:BTB domain-containing protein n=1 Tax=Parthenolecanium corni TaxID=536013 RepID=A0AAN9Y2H4_9HEMI
MNFEDWPLLTTVSPELLSQVRVAHEHDGAVLLVTNDDEVLAYDPNDFSILGLGDTAPSFAPESVVALNQKRVKAVYMWGKNHGTDDVNQILKPTLMDPITKKVLKVACGGEHCLLLNIDGEVFSCGGNTWGQLGINSKEKRVAIPTKIERQFDGKRIAKISCGYNFSAAVLDSGEVFTWGKNYHGQLGVNESGNSYSIPKRVSNLDDTVIKKIVCGSTHVLAVNEFCELYVWGGNTAGQLGLGDIECRRVPVKNEIVGRVTKIASFYSSGTSAALTENFKVFNWGHIASGSNISVPKETNYESLHQVFANLSTDPRMYKSMTRKPRYESVNETLRNAFEDKESSDLIIVAEGREIFVHRTILRLRSDYFRTLLQKHWVTETEKSITIDQSYNAIYAYLKYLYCGELKTEPMSALELLTLAHEYNDLPLKRLCEKTIQCGITIENVASLYAIALKLDGEKLLISCLSFAAEHLSELIDTSGFDEWDVLKVVSVMPAHGSWIHGITLLRQLTHGEVFLVTNDDKVLACGTNKFRILGLGDTAPRFALESVVALNQKRVKAVYMWGKNHGTDDVNPILKPTLMDPITKKVLKVACGREHCLLLNIDGEVFSWGKNTYGQLGINSKKRVATPTKIKRQLAGKRIAKISCGSYFSAAVLDSGEVFTWGKNDYGQLGVSEFKNSCSIPKKVSNLDDTVIKKIVCGDEHVLAVNDVGELYVWGGNACGQLGLGDNECRRVPMKNEIVGRVTKIASFSISYTSAAITENFKVFMWGSCAEGRELRSSISVPKETHYVSLHQVFANVSSYPIMYKSMTRQPRYESVNETLRNAFEDKESSDLIIVAEGKEIFVHRTILRLRSDYFRTLLQKHWVPETEKSITIDKSYNAIYAYLEYLYCGELKTEPMLALDREVLLVTNDDEVLACGTNYSGCLGLEDTAPRFEPESVVALNQKRVKGFVFGGYGEFFVIAHCFTGAVYMWGKNHGTGEENPILKPTLMDQITKKVLKVACGGKHCLLLNIDGEVFSWGGNDYGQLGINSEKKRVAAPTKVEGQLAGKLVAKISCGSYFSAAVLDCGEVFTWGNNDEGQLGVNESGNSYSIPKRVSNLDDTVIKKIVCGSDHVLAVNEDSELYVWGGNNFGQLGLRDEVCRLVPVKNNLVRRVTKIASIYSSWTSAALTENFKVFMWGGCAGLNICVPKETHYKSLHQVFANFSSYPSMYKSMTQQPRYESVNETLRNAFEDKNSSDLIIMAEGKEIFVHRTILKLRSDYFRTLLQKHWVTETEKSITIDQSYNAIYAYLKYLYCGELKTEPMSALELLTLADEYNDLPLKRLCEKTIQCGITIENVASLYAIALKLDGKKLLKSCLSFAAKHLSELIDTSGFDEWDVITVKTFFRECRNRRLFKS